MLYKNLENNIQINNDEDNNFYNFNIKSKKDSFLLSNNNRLRRNKLRSKTDDFYFLNGSGDKKSLANSFFSSFSFSKKSTSPTSLRKAVSPSPFPIYLRLKQYDQIEKIVKEESRKKYFPKRLNLGNNNLSAEELKFRMKNLVPKNVYKRQIIIKNKGKMKLKNKTFFIKKFNKDSKIDLDKNLHELILTNKKLINNFGKFHYDRELRTSRKNLTLVNNYFHKAEEQNKIISLLNKRFSKIELINKEAYENSLQSNKPFTRKLSNKKFSTLRNRLYHKKLKKIKEKSKVFDDIISEELNNNFEKIKTIKSDIISRNKIDYVSLSNKVFLTNLIKQMKIIYIKDPAMNTLRGKDTKRITDIKKEVSIYDEFEGLYNKYNDDITFSRYNKIKLSLPKFIKTKFHKKTIKKYGTICDNHFGVPV